ncbi:DUF397 domain-containing protein [Streptomyces sp. NPDC003042]
MAEHTWQRSSYCAEGNSCVYVTPGGDDHVLVAESATPGTVIVTTAAAWGALVEALKAAA